MHKNFSGLKLFACAENTKINLQRLSRKGEERLVFVFLDQAARARGVDCVVAPYEADAQLAYLSKSGLAQAVITEDSDLLAFGCKKVSKLRRCISSCMLPPLCMQPHISVKKEFILNLV